MHPVRWALSHRQLRPVETVILYLLARAVDETGTCQVLPATLAADTEVSRRQVSTVIRGLSRRGLVKLDASSHPNIITLLMSDPIDLTDVDHPPLLVWWALTRRGLSPDYKIILMAIAAGADKNFGRRVSLPQLAAETNLSASCVYKKVHQMTDRGLLRIKPGGGPGNNITYVLRGYPE
ncbi:helix-turn-helix domain-containing protein [Micromonospora sp. NPDC048843]|uniref:helix-turn-helix domain-containing protein n=1 Tax=Micromonospora sp. NPDC048843 TaxID=3155389 RepID=UPI00340A7C0E